MEMLMSLVNEKMTTEGPSSQKGPTHLELSNSREDHSYPPRFTPLYAQTSKGHTY